MRAWTDDLEKKAKWRKIQTVWFSSGERLVSTSMEKRYKRIQACYVDLKRTQNVSKAALREMIAVDIMREAATAQKSRSKACEEALARLQEDARRHATVKRASSAADRQQTEAEKQAITAKRRMPMAGLPWKSP